MVHQYAMRVLFRCNLEISAVQIAEPVKAVCRQRFPYGWAGPWHYGQESFKLRQDTSSYRLRARMRSARSACSFSSPLVAANREVCRPVVCPGCKMLWFADSTLQPVLLMVLFIVLFMVHDVAEALPPGLLPASAMLLSAESKAAPADSAWGFPGAG